MVGERVEGCIRVEVKADWEDESKRKNECEGEGGGEC